MVAMALYGYLLIVDKGASPRQAVAALRLRAFP